MAKFKITPHIKIIFVGFVILSQFLFFGCSEDVFFHKKTEIINDIWKYDDTITFELNISDTTQLYNLFFTIENTQDYTNSNLWIFVTTKSPDAYILKDTLEFFLADDMGKWYGEKSSDNYRSYSYFKKDVIFPKKGIYSFAVQQGMRHFNLIGISEFGLIVKESGKKQIK